MGQVRNYAWPVTTLGKYDYDALFLCVKKYKEKFKNKTIVIFGAGIRGTSFSILLTQAGFEDIVFTDNNEMKVGGVINEFPIIPYAKVVEMKDDVVVLISVENGYNILEQLTQSGFKEYENCFFVENYLNDSYTKEFIRKGDYEVIFMGDCGLTDISIKDQEHRNIGEMLIDRMGQDKIKVLAIHAMGMRAFYNIFKAHIHNIAKPQKLVVMANFETFTGKQHLLPRSQHSELIKKINELVENKNDELFEYVEVTKERFSNFKMDYFTSSTSGVSSELKERNDKIVLKMNYMYSLKEENEGIVYLKKLIEYCNENEIEPIIFIPPVNYMYATKLLGPEFMELYEKNVEHLKDIVGKYGYGVLDLSYVLGEHQFADVCTIDETANYEGRKIIVENLINKVKGIKVS